MEEKKSQQDLKIHLIKKIYITDILNINIEKGNKEEMTKVIDLIYEQFADILQHRIAIDDNKDFLRISMENRMQFIAHNKTSSHKIVDDDEIIKKVTGEDIIWFR